MKRKALASSNSGPPGWVMIGFFGLFAAVGLGTGYFLTYKPLAGIVAARSWEEVPCVILTSYVEESSSDDGTTYRVAMTYSYYYGEQEYTGDSYDFSTGSSSGYDGKADVVAAYPPGTETSCWVDPEEPYTSVVNREPGLYLLWGLFALPFLAVGFGGLFFIFFRMGKDTSRQARGAGGPSERARPSAPRASTSVADASSNVPLVLEPKASPLARAVGLTFVALFWNGIVSVFVVPMVLEYRRIGFGGVDGCGTVFMIPFVLVGLGLIAAVIHQALATTNPRPHLVLRDGRPTPGTVCDLRWRLDGRSVQLDNLKITVVGREAATYTRGTTTTTDHETFFEEVLLNAQHPRSPQHSRKHSGNLTVSIPEVTMPSFETAHNKIEWMITVHGDIPNWPDIEEEFLFTVYPPRGDER